MDELIDHELKVDIATGLILLFLVVSFLLFIGIFINKLARASRTIRNSRYKNKVENTLNEVVAEFEILSENQLDQLKDQLSILAVRHWQKQIFTDILIHYKINLSGDVELFIKELFYHLKLHEMCTKDLSSTVLNDQIRAMRYLSEMGHEPAWMEIIKYINHPRKLVRVEASLSLIYLTRRPLFFLDNLKHKLTNWQKINIYKRLTEIPRDKIPAFDRWYYNPNHSVRLFAIEMTAKFNQSDLKEQLVGLLLMDESDEIKIQAVQALIGLEAYEYVDELVKALEKCTNKKLKLSLIIAVGELGMDEQIADLLEAHLLCPELNLRLEAAKGLLRMPDGEVRLASKAQQNPDLLNPIIEHLSNPLLK